MSQPNLNPQNEQHRRQWLTLAGQCRRKINLAWWLDSLTIPLTILAILTALTIILLRKFYADLALSYQILIPLAGLFMAAIAAYLPARKHFESLQGILVRLDAHLKLNNALTSAFDQRGPWPAIPENLKNPTGNQWKLGRLLLPIASTSALLLSSFLIPVSAMSLTAQQSKQPHAWQVLDAALEELDENEIVDKDYIEKKREELDQLRQKDSEEWFSHSTLEATDNLHNSLKSDASELKRQLEQASHALNQLNEFGSEMTEKNKERLMNEYQDAMKQLESGAMKPNKDLAERLSQLDPELLKQLDKLDSKQMEELKQKMKEAMEGLDQLGGNGWPEQPKPGGGKDDSEDGDDEEGPGQGGVLRGPGHAGNATGKEKDQLNTGNIIPLESNDTNSPLPGDLLQTTDSDHDVDKTPTGPQAGGNTQNQGSGGNRVWKNSLLPKEKKALKNFLK
ncbi:hypothetical protein Rhal01_00229 [Rubritalea halochordaticola]|uniref:DUF4175 domain-containing protein n=1 Tax=Rubritalea halochordaticola TaxID=714537 RepID=A0ABP9UUC6_9BACT